VLRRVRDANEQGECRPRCGRSGAAEDRLLEELLPIAQYIQIRYRAGNRLKVRWLSGFQPYDAILWTPLLMVRNAGMPRKITLEVTTSTHEFAHIARQQIGSPVGAAASRYTNIVNLALASRAPVSVDHILINFRSLVDVI
jgi:hypothetical protein